MPVFSLALIWCWGMRETCASVSGHHFSHIKSHFNDFKQNFKIWGYLQKRHFTKVSAATEGVRYNCEGLALTPFTDSKFSWLRHGANYFRCRRENLGQFLNFLYKIFLKKLFFFIFDFLAKIFDPSRQLSMPGRFDFMKFFVWRMLEKNVSWFQLFVYIFQKKLFFFSNFCFTEKISLSIAYYDEFSIFEILSQGPRPQNFWWKFHEFENSP